MTKWLNKIKDAWKTKISFRPIVYMTNKPIRVVKAMNDDYRYDIIIGDKVAIQVLRVSDDRMARGYRSSLTIYDESIKDVDNGVMRAEVMAYDGVIEHTNYMNELDEGLEW